MRLLRANNSSQVSLTADFADNQRPPYAILSHCWAKDNSEEVTFTEIETDIGRKKPGYKKIQFCAEQAQRDGIEYIWVDTCCIDKSNHVELSEAIMSMFRWYHEAKKCYVYLPDDLVQISHGQPDPQHDWTPSFRKSCWFTRGWTLQELLAPKVVEFFAFNGSLLGTKQTLAALINEITTIPVAALQNTPLSQFSIDEKIRWTRDRQTAKPEDRAYCLLGVFDIFMPLIYGEGDNAIKRLEEEISKRLGNRVTGIFSGHQEMQSLGLCLNSAPLIESTDFVGRADELKCIHATLQPDVSRKEQKRVVLGGLGGMGKTQLAIAYSRQHQQSYTSVLWLNATSETTLYAGLCPVAQAITEQFNTSSNEQVLAAVMKWLNRPDNTRWLLIFDNYDDPDLFAINNFCPAAGHGSVVVTTRLPDLVIGKPVRLERLSDSSDSLKILEIRSGRSNVQEDPGALRLAKRLDGFPLALVTAGAFLRKTTMTFEQYLDTYERKWNINPRRRLHLQEYQDRTLYTTWNLSYDRLCKKDPNAAQMLRLMAYFDNQRVWYDLLTAGLTDDSPEWLQATLEDQATFEGTMAVLVDYYFVEVQHITQSYSMHNCVHDWTLGELNATMSPELYWYAFDCVAKSIENHDHDLFDHAKYSHISQHARRLTHLRFEACNELSVGITGREEQAMDIGQMLILRGQLPAAEQLYLRALARYEITVEPDHILTLHTVDSLGVLYALQGKLEQAEQMLSRALAGSESALGPSHSSTLTAARNLFEIYRAQHRHTEAEALRVRYSL